MKLAVTYNDDNFERVEVVDTESKRGEELFEKHHRSAIKVPDNTPLGVQSSIFHIRFTDSTTRYDYSMHFHVDRESEQAIIDKLTDKDGNEIETFLIRGHQIIVANGEQGNVLDIALPSSELSITGKAQKNNLIAAIQRTGAANDALSEDLSRVLDEDSDDDDLETYRPEVDTQPTYGEENTTETTNTQN